MANRKSTSLALPTVLNTEKSDVKIATYQIDALKPHEKGSPVYLELLRQEILNDNILKYPIIADEKTGVILDGMHRWLALKSLGYERIPVIAVDALKNGKIRVGRRRIHRYMPDSDEEIPVKKVIAAGLSGRLMEPRSTRHFFPFSRFQLLNCPLHTLGRRDPQDVSNYLADTTTKESRLAIKEWLEEIFEELKFLKRRREEVEKEMEEFLHRARSLENGSLLI